TEDEAARPAPPAVAYVDFAAWQRARLSGARWDRLLAYWRDRLGGVEPLELPPMPAGLEEEDGQVAETIPADLIGRIGARAAAAGATPYMAMLTVFAAIVYRYTG